MYLIYFELQTSDKYNLFKMTKGERLVQSLNLKHPLCFVWPFLAIDDKGGEIWLKLKEERDESLRGRDMFKASGVQPCV